MVDVEALEVGLEAASEGRASVCYHPMWYPKGVDIAMQNHPSTVCQLIWHNLSKDES